MRRLACGRSKPDWHSSGLQETGCSQQEGTANLRLRLGMLDRQVYSAPAIYLRALGKADMFPIAKPPTWSGCMWVVTRLVTYSAEMQQRESRQATGLPLEKPE